MFGLSFGELVILGVIALVVVGPRQLPSMLRTAGQLIGKVRRMAMDIRAESGIDEILNAEGIRSEIDNFRRLATGEIPLDDPVRTILPDRDREYPRVGSDSYGALSEEILPYSPAPALEASPAPKVDASSAQADENADVAQGEPMGAAIATDGGSVATAAVENGGNLTPPAVDSGGLAPTGAEVKS